MKRAKVPKISQTFQILSKIFDKHWTNLYFDSGGIMEIPESGSMEGQLVLLYQEKEFLERELGTSDPQELVAMVKSLEEQLATLYAEKEQHEETELELRFEGKTLLVTGCDQVIVRRKKQ
ncbi:MAG: hypothetical protein NZM25_05910 [Leptospiraceae bacterium]|nr:hypothetical protein [Leptospiraceae bacterium]MDW8306690.1 hypothetical protein [Leptospiraceae bacterium]